MNRCVMSRPFDDVTGSQQAGNRNGKGTTERQMTVRSFTLSAEQREALASYRKQKLLGTAGGSFARTLPRVKYARGRSVSARSAEAPQPARNSHVSESREKEQHLARTLDYLLDGTARGNSAKKAAAERIMRAMTPDVSNAFMFEYAGKYDAAAASYRTARSSFLVAATQNLADVVTDVVENSKAAVDEIARRTQNMIHDFALTLPARVEAPIITTDV